MLVTSLQEHIFMYRLKKVNISMGDYVGIIVICVYTVPIVKPILRLLAF